MARFKPYNRDQNKLIPVVFSEQILPGSFEYTVDYLIDHEIDLSVFDDWYNNDDTGAPAYDPALLLKIVLVAYSRGVTSSRNIERLCRENVESASITADSGFHSMATLEYCEDQQLDAYIADGNYRKRDPRFKDRDRFQPKDRKRQHFGPDDFFYDAAIGECRCPAGKVMWCHGERERYGNSYINFVGHLKDCRTCPLQKQCM